MSTPAKQRARLRNAIEAYGRAMLELGRNSAIQDADYRDAYEVAERAKARVKKLLSGTRIAAPPTTDFENNQHLFRRL